MNPFQFNTMNDPSTVLEELKQNAAYRHAPVSGFYVAAMAVNTEGLAVIAPNWEFLNAQTGHGNTIHAEQAVVTLARFHSLNNIEKLYVTEWPCGHCRQFLGELGNSDLEIIHTPTQETIILRHLLTESFNWYPQTPSAFAIEDEESEIIPPPTLPLHLNMPFDESLQALAKQAMAQSYHPYSITMSGVVIETTNGKRYPGSIIESNAFNPTLPAFQAAWMAYWMDRDIQNKSDITQIMMCEGQENKVFYRMQAEDCIQALQQEGLLNKSVQLEYQIVSE